MSREYVSRLENGHKAPTLRSIDTIAKTFGLTLSQLLDGI